MHRILRFRLSPGRQLQTLFADGSERGLPLQVHFLGECVVFAAVFRHFLIHSFDIAGFFAG